MNVEPFWRYKYLTVASGVIIYSVFTDFIEITVEHHYRERARNGLSLNRCGICVINRASDNAIIKSVMWII